MVEFLTSRQPGYSGATVPDSHRLPRTIALDGRQPIVFGVPMATPTAPS
jgi:hypothetical protein